MKKHYETHVEDTDKLISVTGPELDYKSWYEQYRKLMEEQAQRKYGLYTPTSEGDDDDFPSIPGMIARYSALGLTNEQMKENPVWVDKTGNGHDLQMKNFAWKEGSGISDIYPGALVFDGVDDSGVCDNFPILTKEKGYTVVALRQWISMGEGLYGLVSNTKNWFNDGAFILEYSSNNATNKFVNRPVSFGKVNIEMDLPNNFTYQTSKSYKGIPITTGSFKGTNSLFVGRLNNIIGNCSNAAIWELVFLDHDATEEEPVINRDFSRILALNVLNEEITKEINTYDLTPGEALQVKDHYPEWVAGITVKVGERYLSDNVLWECIKEHTTQDNWKPSMATASLWKVVDEEHKGTIDDPIVYIPPMEIFKDKYYIQNGVKYKCTRNSEQPLTHDLSALVGLYVETI